MSGDLLLPNQVPTDPEDAKEMLSRIDSGGIEPHPTYADEILRKLRDAVDGALPEPGTFDDIFGNIPPDIQPQLRKLSAKQVEDMLTRALGPHCGESLRVRVDTFASHFDSYRGADFEIKFRVDAIATSRDTS